MTRYAPLYNQSLSYPAQLDRQLLGSLWPAGGADGGAVTAVADTMNVSIAPGSAGVPLQPGQGTALSHWDAAEVVTIPPAPPAGQTRQDLIVAQVRDTAIDGGPSNDFIFTVVAGTPAALRAETREEEGDEAEAEQQAVAPAVPANALALATVTVPGAAANLNAATITDRRWSLIGGPYTAAYCRTAYVNANSSYQVLTLDATEEGGGFWDVGNKQFVVPVPGRYLITAKAQCDRAVAFAWLEIKKNGGTVRQGPNANQPATNTYANTAPGIATAVRAAVGDRLEVGSVTGGACNVLAGAHLTYAQFSYLGA